jgi:OTT_1508-like deaminase
MIVTGDKDALQIDNLHGWLAKYFGDGIEGFSQPSFLDLVDACYKIRHTQLLKTIRVFAGQGRTRAQQFERLYKLLGKLGRPIMSSKNLIEGAMTLSQDLVQGFTVKTIPPSKLRLIPIRPKEETTIKSIAGRMFSSKKEQEEFMERLSYLKGEEFDVFIQDERSKKTRVHAELLLIDHFERTGCNFLDAHEKYIGCSKPACYLCHMYIAQHPGRYVVPACHNKLYIAWRPPDAFVGDTSGTLSAAAQEKIVLKMIEIVRKDLVTEIFSRTMRRPIHADSTTGITSTLDSVHVDEHFLPQDTYRDDQSIFHLLLTLVSSLPEER